MEALCTTDATAPISTVVVVSYLLLIQGRQELTSTTL